ncbi:MAG TPA: RDD family protein [Rhodanobacteraceae bacterium]|nr:RDD family protein [Rhodanobacteraceae bacterium]
MNAGAPLHWLPPHAQCPGLYAGFWLRVVAWLIDGLLLAPVYVLSYLVVQGSSAVPLAMQPGGLLPFHVWPSLWAVGLLVPWLYFALCEASRWQATPGKLALGLRVTDEYGRRTGFARASGRFFGKLVSSMILDVGYLLAGWTARKQALHDFMAGCCVVRKAGLEAWRHELASSETPGTAALVPPRTGLPGWAMAMIAIVVGVFVLLPVAAVLAAIAIPAWHRYTVRTEVTQGIELTLRARSLVAEYIGQRGTLPPGNAALGLPEPHAIQARYVTSVAVSGGKVVVTYGNHANPWIRGGHVVISPVGNAARLHWQCSSPDIRDRYLPESCR